jgi:hypothetical protein
MITQLRSSDKDLILLPSSLQFTVLSLHHLGFVLWWEKRRGPIPSLSQLKFPWKFLIRQQQNSFQLFMEKVHFQQNFHVCSGFISSSIKCQFSPHSWEKFIGKLDSQMLLKQCSFRWTIHVHKCIHRTHPYVSAGNKICVSVNKSSILGRCLHLCDILRTSPT